MNPLLSPTRPRAFIYEPPDTPLKVVHADSAILVLDKPSGLLTVPGKTQNLSDCLQERAREHFPSALIVHRLDKDTSGLIVLGLTPQAHVHLGKQFEKRQTQKTYQALVWGAPEQKGGRIDAPLIADWPNRPKQHIDHENGRPAITDWELVETLNGTSRIRLQPHTGRTHQLRVHLAALGHPILGDNLYAHQDALAAASRLCLHAERLDFFHPDGGERMHFLSTAPF